MATRFSRLTSPALGCAAVLMMILAGCDAVADWTKTDAHRFISPDKIIEPPDRSPINPILNSTSLVDQTQELVPNASFPTEGDWEYTEKDYVIGPTDVLIIYILDLFQEGLETPLRREVSDTGYIDMPLLAERIKAEGLTKDELTQAIMQAYSPQIIRNPTVSVTIEARRQSTYYILGAVSRPSQYMIGRRDMRLLEALAIAGGVVQNNIPYIYVIRPSPAGRTAEEGLETGKAGVPEVLPESLPELLPEPLEARPAPGQPAPVAPVVPGMPSPALPREEPLQPKVLPGTAPASPEAIRRATEAVQSNDIEAALRELGKAVPPGAAAPPPSSPAPSVLPRMSAMSADEGSPDVAGTSPAGVPGMKWVYRDGKWIRAPKNPPVPAAPPQAPPPPAGQEAMQGLPPTPSTAPGTQPIRRIEDLARGASTAPAGAEDPFGWRKASKSDMARIIAINLQKLNDGDPRQNIVIRDNDIIHVPYLPVGEFYVTGEVLRPGVYALPSTPVTIKQALSAAGNVGPLSWPENSVLIRRIGRSQEQILPLNIEAIFRGEEPDLFLKPNDIIAVGTDVRAPFFAVLRNAFRMTYGFGFIYDRNFADPLLPGYTPKSNRFTRW